MPGGNPTIKSELLDLGTFLERKRKPLDVWLIQNNITSEQALQAFIKNSEWAVSEKLIETIRSFFITATSTIPEIPPQQPEPLPVKQEVVVEVVVEEKFKDLPSPSPVVLETEQPTEEVISTSEEIVPLVEEEESTETRSVVTNRERKKNR